jgi:hypothetical protein
MIPDHFADRFQEVDASHSNHHFKYIWNKSGRDSLYHNGERVLTRIPRAALIDRLGSQMRLTVAEFAIDRVFVHAGVVGWKGSAIIIPGPSFSGKTSLVAALVRHGAEYYSDEYAVFDKDGMVEPFPKKLSIRGEIDKYVQVDHSIEELGGKEGMKSIKPALVLFAKYKPGAKWNPEILSTARGITELIKDTVAIRRDPAFCLSVLRRASENVRFFRSKRGETSDVIKSVPELLDQ